MANFIGTGIVGLSGGTSCVYTTPWPVALGTRARDAEGNEYVFCDFTGTVSEHQPVVISSDWTAAAVSTTGRGSVGIVQADVGTSDHGGWVLIYGRSMMMIIGTETAVSPSIDGNGPTTLSTSAQTVFMLPTSVVSPGAFAWVSGNTSTTAGIFVEGLTVATDASVSDSVSLVTFTTGTSGAHTGSQVAVFLNYPRLVSRNYGVN
jgi:hypothetical protein